MNAAPAPNNFTVRFNFHGSLSFFLSREDRAEPITKLLREKTSVKDAIESCGAPHPEGDLICCNGQAVPFEHCLIADANVAVHGVIDSPAKPGGASQQP